MVTEEMLKMIQELDRRLAAIEAKLGIYPVKFKRCGLNEKISCGCGSSQPGRREGN